MIMTDQQILNNIDFIHESGLGRGGYSINLSPSTWQLYEYNLILESFGGEYVNPIGPFRKWIILYAKIYSAEKEYRLHFKKEFWKTCTEQDCFELYIKPFVFLLRKFVHGQIDAKTIWQNHEEYSASVTNLNEENRMLFPDWLYNLQYKNSL